MRQKNRFSLFFIFLSFFPAQLLSRLQTKHRRRPIRSRFCPILPSGSSMQDRWRWQCTSRRFLFSPFPDIHTAVHGGCGCLFFEDFPHLLYNFFDFINRYAVYDFKIDLLFFSTVFRFILSGSFFVMVFVPCFADQIGI